MRDKCGWGFCRLYFSRDQSYKIGDNRRGRYSPCESPLALIDVRPSEPSAKTHIGPDSLVSASRAKRIVARWLAKYRDYTNNSVRMAGAPSKLEKAAADSTQAIDGCHRYRSSVPAGSVLNCHAQFCSQGY